ncbi:IclR family transcriptional regulator [Candidatus Halobonum tyrrellensis]|uniref:IclR family transcriptional regulator n=1 Tax=Candidatus Halobonum tyrrellensis G22 TaxID=1324957 RepID=V4HGW1_9EURY|nr:IclR family transcriptional regulator [Candidatus Halobonum tyrrellensis]ESP87069.1 IclR family transcriptional regulator [Candidatus Halobonum tyrrellensis G22]
MGDQAKNPIKGTEKTILIVEALKEMDGAGVSELAERVGLSKGTVHDYLSTLRQHNYVVKEGNTYYVGLGFFELGEYARNRLHIYHVAKSEVDNLAAETGELANLLYEEHGLGVYLYRARGENAVTLDTHTGKRRYLHNTALGKAILAYMPDHRVEAILDQHGLPRATERTITDREELYEELAAVRDRGYAYCNQERVEGLQCIATPLISRADGAVLGAISVAGPTTRMTNDRVGEEILDRLLQAANVVEINVNYA